MKTLAQPRPAVVLRAGPAYGGEGGLGRLSQQHGLMECGGHTWLSGFKPNQFKAQLRRPAAVFQMLTATSPGETPGHLCPRRHFCMAEMFHRVQPEGSQRM